MGASQVPQVTLTGPDGSPITVTGGALTTTGGGGSGGAITVADGADVALGTTTDAEVTGNGTLVAILKRVRTQVTAVLAKLPALGTAGTASSDVITVQGIANGTTLAVDSTTARRGTLTDRSGTITAGGTAQQLIASNAARKYLLLRNPLNATEELWFNFTTTAVADSPSIRLDPGDIFVMEGGYITTEAISVFGATTGHKITAKEG